MSLGPWFYVLLIGIGGLHVLVALLVLRFESGRTVDRRGWADTTGRSSAAEYVTCPECETENDRQYRYCRQCVSELPGMQSADQARTATAGRELF